MFGGKLLKASHSGEVAAYADGEGERKTKKYYISIEDFKKDFFLSDFYVYKNLPIPATASVLIERFHIPIF